MAAALSPTALVDVFARAWALPKPEAFLDGFVPHLHPDVVLEQPGMPATCGISAFAEAFRRLFTLVPDLTAAVEFWAASGDSVLIIATAEGTIGRRRVTFVVCDRFDLADGMIVRRQAFFDPTTLRRAVARQPRVWPAAWHVARGA
jgi:limonene-1,2-epoxide hydrolase